MNLNVQGQFGFAQADWCGRLFSAFAARRICAGTVVAIPEFTGI